MTTRSGSLSPALVLGLLIFLPGLVLAGPNAGGTLILHANPSLVFTSDMQGYCGQSALDSCAAAVTSVGWVTGQKIVFHAVAAFPPESQPRLKAISFGIDYDPTKFVMAARGSCADFELPDGTWPAAGTGTAQSWTTGAQTGLLTEVYWLCGYAYSEQDGEDSTSVALTPHPLQHGVFVDDAFPAEQDTIAGYGVLGFGMQGRLPCPQALDVDSDSWTNDADADGADTAEESTTTDCIQYAPYLHWTSCVDLPGSSAYRVAASSDHVYIANGSEGLQVLDVSDPKAPRIVGACATSGVAYGVAVAGSYAYVTGNGVGFEVINISNPASPHVVGSLNVPMAGTTVAVQGNRAYVGTYSTVVVINISNPGSPQVDTQVQGLSWPIDALDVEGWFAYVRHGGGFSVVNLLPSPPTVVGTVGVAGVGWDLQVSGAYCYVASGIQGLHVIDIVDPEHPHIEGTIDTPGAAVGVAVAGPLAYVCDGAFGIQVVDISAPGSPQIVGNIRFPDACWAALDSAWDYAFVTTSSGMEVIDISASVPLQVIGHAETQGIATGVAAPVDSVKLFVYVAAGDGGLRVINATNPALPQTIGHVETPGSAEGVGVQVGHAYVADGAAGLTVVDVSLPATPSIVANLYLSGGAHGVVASGAYAYVAAGTYGLAIVDIRTPESPDFVSRLVTGGAGDASSVAVTIGRAYMADGHNGLQVIDVSAPWSPSLLCTVDTPGTASGVAVGESFAYVADGESGLQIVSIANLQNAHIVGALNTPGNASAVTWTGTHVYVADSVVGLVVIDVSDPEDPWTVGCASTPGSASGVFVGPRGVYVADGESGLQILPVQCDLCSSVSTRAPASSSARLLIRPNPSTGPFAIYPDVRSERIVGAGIYSAAGRLVRTLSAGSASGGIPELLWDGRGQDGGNVPAGSYVIRARTGDGVRTGRVIVLR